MVRLVSVTVCWAHRPAVDVNHFYFFFSFHKLATIKSVDDGQNTDTYYIILFLKKRDTFILQLCLSSVDVLKK